MAQDRDAILIVDDHPTNVGILLLLDRLQNAGFDTFIAEDGESAIEQVHRVKPDLVLLDVMMPGMDGFETCHRLKLDKTTQDIPVIFMTALSEIEDKVKGFEIGAVDYVTKPIQPAEVLARVNAHITIRNLQKSLQKEIVERDKLIAELDAFAHTVAHDLKNPLSALIGFADVLEHTRSKLSEEKQQEYLHAIGRNGRKMRNIINELLLLSSVRGVEDVLMKPLDTANIVAEVQRSLSHLIEEYKAEIIVPDDWPVALGHAPWVEEVWANYLTNALKYGGSPPRVELGADPFFTPPPQAEGIEGGMVRFWVSDNGPGLTPGEQERLFAPFERLNQVRVEGHGLGLSIVRRITEKLGGQAGVESEVGQGSVFSFTLPSVAVEHETREEK
jgi:two-component system sensor histidine kinase/response regulator